MTPIIKKEAEADNASLAHLISKYVSSLEEVNFNKSTFINKLSKELKKKPDTKFRYKWKSLWTNSNALRTEVARILASKASKSSINGTAFEDDSVKSKSIVSHVPLEDISCLDVEIENRRATSMTSDVIGEDVVTSTFHDHQGMTSDVIGEDVGISSFYDDQGNLAKKIDNVYDDGACSSITLTPKVSSISSIHGRREIANCAPAIAKNVSTSSIYDFSYSEYSEEEFYENKENLCPKTLSPKPQTRKEIYVVDLGAKYPFSARFKDTNGIVTKDTIRRGLRTVLAMEYGGTCCLRFGTIRCNETDWVAYATCLSAEHSQYFKFVVMNWQELVATVFAKSSAKISFNHDKISFTHLRGTEREEVKYALQSRPPRDYQMEVARSIDPELAANGNMQALRRLYVYQKAKSEEDCKNDLLLKSGDLSDLMQLWAVQNNQKDPYLRYVSLPLTVMMFTEAQLNILDHAKGVVLHLDATGSVVRKPPNIDCKRIYYYVIVMKYEESVIPLAEMVTSEHNIRSIANFLKAYKFFVQEKRNTWPFVSAIVVDWSWALLNSIFFEWNQMSVGQYLNMAYSYVKQSERPKNIIIVQTCCAHFMKRMSTIIKKDFSQYQDKKSFLLECIAVMVLCRHMAELDTVFEHFVNIVSTPDEHDAQSSLRALGKIVQQRQVEIEGITKESQEEHDGEEITAEKIKPRTDPASLKKSKSIFANSPFFIHFEAKLNEVEREIDQGKPITNRYHVPGFAKHMTWKHLPYAPLWTSLMLDLVDGNISRLSNAYVESYHRVIKHQVLNHQKNLKIGHFIRKTELYTRSLMAEANLNVSLKTREATKKPKYPKTVRTNVIGASKSKECDIAEKHMAVDDLDRGDPSQKNDSKTKILELEIDSEKNCPDEASDPLVGEMWKDSKKSVRARGHFKGNVIEHLVDQMNKKGSKKKEMSTNVSEISLKVIEPELNTLDCNDLASYNFTDKENSLVQNYDVFENGLFKDVDYYKQSKSHNVRIAYFFAEKNPPIRSNCFELTARQFHTLTPNRWIDGLAIDCYSLSTNVSEISLKVIEPELNTLDCNDLASYNFTDKENSLVQNYDVFENGLFKDVDYYKQSKSHNVRIAYFFAEKNPPIRSNCFELTARQFHTLTPNRWIDGLAIDCYSMTHIDEWSNGMYLSTDDTSSIFGSNWGYRKPSHCGIYNISRTLSGKIFMPYMYHGHWRLFVVDINDKTLTLLDPYEFTHDQDRVIEAFKQFIVACNKNSAVNALKKIQWSIKNEERPRPYQHPHDTVNCGAYVIHYVECLAKNEPFDLTFDPLVFREHVALTLIQKSKCIKEMCLYCFGKRHQYAVTVCEVCRHWCHTSCLEKGEYNSEEEEDENDQLNRFKKRSKIAAKGPQQKIKAIDTNQHVTYKCKLCIRNHK